MEALIQILLSNALVAGVPALLAMAAARWIRRPALVHALWLLALLKLVTPPVVDVNFKVLPARGVSVEGSGVRVQGSGETTSALESVDAPLMVRGAEGSVGNVGHSTLAPGPSVAARLPQGDGGRLGVREVALGAKADWRIPWITIGWVVWLGGAGLTVGLTVLRLWQFNRLLRLAHPAGRGLQAQADQVAGMLGIARCPRVFMVPGALSPMLWAIGSRPRLLLPVALWGRLTDSGRMALLAHELAHFRRRDHWVRYLELAASVLYWWHPLVWISRRGLRAAEEECCDAWVVEALPDHARDYASALMDTVDFVAESHCPTPATCSGIIGAGGAKDLRRRLIMIMNAANSKSMSSLTRLAVLGFGLVLLPALPRLAAADDAPRKPAVEADRPRGDGERKPAAEADRPRGDGERKPVEADRPRGEGDRRPAAEGDRPRGDGEVRRERAPEGDRPRGDADVRRERGPEVPLGPVETSGAGTFMRFERGTVLISDDANDKDIRVAVNDQTKVTVDGQPATFREIRPGMLIKAATVDGVTTLEVKRPRWLKAMMPPVREGERRRDGEGAAPGPRDGEPRRERGPADGDQPRRERGAADGDRPRGEGEIRRDRAPEGDRPRGDGERKPVEGERGRTDAEIRRDVAARDAGPRDAGRGEGRPAEAAVGGQLKGILEKIDGTSILLSSGGSGEPRVIPTDEKTRFTLNGQPGKLADIEPGMLIIVKQVEGLTTEVRASAGRR